MDGFILGVLALVACCCGGSGGNGGRGGGCAGGGCTGSDVFGGGCCSTGIVVHDSRHGPRDHCTSFVVFAACSHSLVDVCRICVLFVTSWTLS